MMQPVRDACSSFFERFLDETNAIGINCFAELHGTQELTRKAKRYVLKKFSQVCILLLLLVLSTAKHVFSLSLLSSSRLYNKMNGCMFLQTKSLNSLVRETFVVIVVDSKRVLIVSLSLFRRR